MTAPTASDTTPSGESTLSEFGLIRQYFTRPARNALLGVGDDCALLAPRPGQAMAISTDMLVSGRHFFANVAPDHLGHKALAVNLSDLAAMGAEPRAFTLALALPEARAEWLEPLAKGMLALADAHNCELIGGDTTKGSLTINITVFGDVPPDQALRRDGAHANDDLWVSGTLGDARLALGTFWQEWTLEPEAFAIARARMETPTPRVALGMALRGLAHAALDVSDGLLGDLGHILKASNLGAVINVDTLPRSAVLATQPPERQLLCLLTGGDDYELCFAAPPSARDAIAALAGPLEVPLTRIGKLTIGSGITLQDQNGAPVEFKGQSFDHFTSQR